METESSDSHRQWSRNSLKKATKRPTPLMAAGNKGCSGRLGGGFDTMIGGADERHIHSLKDVTAEPHRRLSVGHRPPPL